MKELKDFTIGDYINFFSKIPEGAWIVNRIKDHEGGHCAIGHLAETFGRYTSIFILQEKFLNIPIDLILTENITDTFRLDVALAGGENILVAVNNGWHVDYQQPTPKQRVLAFLRDEQKRIDMEVVNTISEEAVESIVEDRELILV